MDQDKHLRQIRNTRQNCQADAQNLTYDGAEFNYDNISTIWNGLHKDGCTAQCRLSALWACQSQESQ